MRTFGSLLVRGLIVGLFAGALIFYFVGQMVDPLATDTSRAPLHAANDGI